MNLNLGTGAAAPAEEGKPASFSEARQHHEYIARVGDIVLVYQHLAADEVHSTADWPGIVLRALPDDKLLVKYWTESEGAVATVGRFEAPVDAAGNPIVGGFYWRPRGEPAPDFDLLYSKEP